MLGSLVTSAAAARPHPAARTPGSRREGCGRTRGSRAGDGRGGHAEAAFGLTAEQVERFREDGFLLVPGFSSVDEVRVLRERAVRLVSESFDPDDVCAVFSTGEEQRHSRGAMGRYFAESASKVSFFLEEAAFDAERGALLVSSKEEAVNKIGHALHELDDVFLAWSHSGRIRRLLSDLGYVQPAIHQSMYLFKQPFVGGEVVPHQDSSFLHTSPRLSCTGLWLALDDATIANGCLWALPRSHGALRRRFRVAPGDTEASFDAPAPDYDLDAMVPLECPAGTLVVLHGENVHMSHANTSASPRHAYSMHVVEGDGSVRWSPDNWLQRDAALPFRPIAHVVVPPQHLPSVPM